MVISTAGKRLLSTTMSNAVSHNRKMEVGKNKIPDLLDVVARTSPLKVDETVGAGVPMSVPSTANVNTFTTGQKLFAKRPVDGIWYTALILDQLDAGIGPGGDNIQYTVAFTNATTGDPNAILPASNIVTDEKFIPDNEVKTVGIRKSQLYPFSTDDTKLDSNSPRLNPDQPVYAKWTEEDSVWYQAKILKQVTNTIYIVQFTDYGNYDLVHIQHIKVSKKDIPTGEPLDDFILVIAKWNEDQVWYRAQIIDINSESEYKVIFVDYGNEALVEKENVVISPEQIPSDALVDENVTLNSDDFEAPTAAEVAPEAKPERSVVTAKYVVGDKIIANWHEDNVWYRGEVTQVDNDKKEYAVHFVDYGNDDIIKEENIVQRKEEIPEGAAIDEYVLPADNHVDSPKDTTDTNVAKKSKPAYSVNDVVIAQWQEDSVWYNALILEVKDNSYKVQFSDYGNEDIVLEDQIVATYIDLPKDATLDEHVVSAENVDAIPKDTLKETTDTTGAKKSQPAYSVNDVVIAQWQEDSVWYNALILEVKDNSYKVQFSDYGNEDIVLEGQIVVTFSDLPKDATLDENVEKSLVEDDNNNTLGKLGTDKNTADADLQVAVTKDKIVPVATRNSAFNVNQLVLAKWDEDGVWYNAIIKSIEDATKYTVIFKDYGNEAAVDEANITLSIDNIPVDEDKDQFVVADDEMLGAKPKTPTTPVPASSDLEPMNAEVRVPGKYCVHQTVIAKWCSDQVWYRAVVTDVQGNQYSVRFTDYGNESIEDGCNIVVSVSDLPANDLVDEHVYLTEPMPELVDHVPMPELKDHVPMPELVDHVPMPELVDHVPMPELVDYIPEPTEHIISNLKVDEAVFARFSEDSVWYNAIITQVLDDQKYLVYFTYYGNEEIVDTSDILTDASKIPTTDMVDEFVKSGGSAEAILDYSNNNSSNSNSSTITVVDIKNVDENLNSEAAVDTTKKIVEDANAMADGQSLSPGSPEVEARDTPGYSIGQKAYAKWDEDQVWYRAIIQEAHSDQGYKVLFCDYGNEDYVKEGSVVLKKKLIPVNDEKDVHISGSPKAEEKASCYSAGQEVFARWTEDQVWYRAVILDPKNTDNKGYKVVFSDYGNEDYVKEDRIVLNKKLIPVEDEVDVNLLDNQNDHESLVAPNVTAQGNISHQVSNVNVTQQETDCNMTAPYHLIAGQSVDASVITGQEKNLPLRQESQDNSTPRTTMVKEIVEKLNQLQLDIDEKGSQNCSPVQNMKIPSKETNNNSPDLKEKRLLAPTESSTVVKSSRRRNGDAERLEPTFNSNVLAINPKTGKEERGVVMVAADKQDYCSVYFPTTGNAEMIPDTSILEVVSSSVKKGVDLDKNSVLNSILEQNTHDSDDSDEDLMKVPKLTELFDIKVSTPIGVSGYNGKIYIAKKKSDLILECDGETGEILNETSIGPLPQQVLPLQSGGLAVTTEKGLTILDSERKIIKKFRSSKYGKMFGLVQNSRDRLLFINTKCEVHVGTSFVTSLDLNTMEVTFLFPLKDTNTYWMEYHRGHLYLTNKDTDEILVYILTGENAELLSEMTIPNNAKGTDKSMMDLVVHKSGAIICIQADRLQVFSPDFKYVGSLLIPGFKQQDNACGVGLYLDSKTDVLYLSVITHNVVKAMKLTM